MTRAFTPQELERGSDPALERDLRIAFSRGRRSATSAELLRARHSWSRGGDAVILPIGSERFAADATDSRVSDSSVLMPMPAARFTAPVFARIAVVAGLAIALLLTLRGDAPYEVTPSAIVTPPATTVASTNLPVKTAARSRRKPAVVARTAAPVEGTAAVPSLPDRTRDVARDVAREVSPSLRGQLVNCAANDETLDLACLNAIARAHGIVSRATLEQRESSGRQLSSDPAPPWRVIQELRPTDGIAFRR